MSFRNNFNVDKVFRRIELKEEYVKLFLPEISFLKFIQELEEFQSLLEGISGKKGLTEKVNLKQIKDKLKELKTNNKKTIDRIATLSANITKHSKIILLLQYQSDLRYYRNLLWQSKEDFLREIELYTNGVYDIKILIQINDALDVLRSEIKTLNNNLKNLERSCLKRNIRHILKHLYRKAILSANKKFRQIENLFPKPTVSSFENKETENMALNKSSSSNQSILADCGETNENGKKEFNYFECLEQDICPCDIPKIPEIFQVQKVCEISSSESSRKANLDEDALVNQYKNVLDKRRDDLYRVLSDLLVKSRDISRIDNEIFTITNETEMQMACFLNKKEKIIVDPLLYEAEKEKEKSIYCAELKLKKKLEGKIKELEDQKLEIKKSSRCMLKELKHLIKLFTREHSSLVDQLERLKIKVFCRDKIDAKIEVLQQNFENEMKKMEEYKEKFSNLYVERGSISSFSSTESDSSSSISSTSLSREMNLLKVKDVKNDKELYIKHFLGKPLIQGLAAITIYQPLDPIYYLANFLLHYRYNELSSMRKQLNFEELLMERDKYAQRVEAEKYQTCDPCNMKENETCN